MSYLPVATKIAKLTVGRTESRRIDETCKSQDIPPHRTSESDNSGNLGVNEQSACLGRGLLACERSFQDTVQHPQDRKLIRP